MFHYFRFVKLMLYYTLVYAAVIGMYKVCVILTCKTVILRVDWVTTVIVINDISDFFPTSVNDPVMSVKRQFITHPGTKSCPWGVGSGFTAKTFQFWILTFISM